MFKLVSFKMIKFKKFRKHITIFSKINFYEDDIETLKGSKVFEMILIILYYNFV